MYILFSIVLIISIVLGYVGHQTLVGTYSVILVSNLMFALYFVVFNYNGCMCNF